MSVQSVLPLDPTLLKNAELPALWQPMGRNPIRDAIPTARLVVKNSKPTSVLRELWLIVVEATFVTKRWS
ncbi:hypothetical protein L596_001473 [Steinernema carpocapsae]|uniref:Uncharacterized protein n=1 Tax=Steinernema carpocapsae TaxID=34508 RepID=A0A4U8ULN6_STECR|nr:hypothetical protein L596_001473 [Steinernema carpocapsae]